MYNANIQWEIDSAKFQYCSQFPAECRAEARARNQTDYSAGGTDGSRLR